MNAIALDPRLIGLAAQMKRICAPPPESNLPKRKRDRKLALNSYSMNQEDKLYLLLCRANVDVHSFMLLMAAGQHFMCAGEIERFQDQTAFEGGWGRRAPRKARAHIASDLDVLQRECAKLIENAKTALSKGEHGGAAHYALCAIKRAGMAGIRIAALIELEGYDTGCGAKLADLIQLLDRKPEPTLVS